MKRNHCGTLKGTSGLVPGLGYINAAYSCNRDDLVFVVWHFRKPEPYTRWKRMTLKRALRENRQIILCRIRGCKKPAAMISHSHPYIIEHNLCENHAKKHG